jgi:hypothetical protein
MVVDLLCFMPSEENFVSEIALREKWSDPKEHWIDEHNVTSVVSCGAICPIADVVLLMWSVQVPPVMDLEKCDALLPFWPIKTQETKDFPWPLRASNMKILLCSYPACIWILLFHEPFSVAVSPACYPLWTHFELSSPFILFARKSVIMYC